MRRLGTVVGLAASGFVLVGWLDVEIEAPLVVPEGGEAVLTAVVPDAESVEYAWELDEDARFDDSNQQQPLFSAAELDGPTEAYIWLHVVEEGGREAYRVARIEIANVPPTILSEPMRVARRGFLYQYEIEAVDPGAADSERLYYELAEDVGPEEMSVMGRGLLQWTPRAADIGTHLVRVLVEDKDGGVAAQNFLLEVVDNTDPFGPNGAPMPGGGCLRSLQPVLAVGNTNDPDGDVLTYFFEIGDDPSFEGTGGIASPPLRQGIGGFTRWRVSRPLEQGTIYYWRAWVSDGVDRSEQIRGALCTQGEGPIDLVPPDEIEEEEVDGSWPVGPEVHYGCRTASSRATGARFPSLLLTVVSLAFLRFRRPR